MIFNVPGHIDMIRNGLSPSLFQVLPTYPAKCIPEEVIKTQTRRLNRGIYRVGKDYAVQKKRGVKAEPDIRIVMDRIWEETGKVSFITPSGRRYGNPGEMHITKEDAQAEGNYTPEQYEKIFREINPRWYGFSRWAYEFHAIEVQR